MASAAAAPKLLSQGKIRLNIGLEIEKLRTPGGLWRLLRCSPSILWTEPANDNKEKEVISTNTADLELKMR